MHMCLCVAWVYVLVHCFYDLLCLFIIRADLQSGEAQNMLPQGSNISCKYFVNISLYICISMQMERCIKSKCGKKGHIFALISCLHGEDLKNKITWFVSCCL